jgi:hypothetical protein
MKKNKYINRTAALVTSVGIFALVGCEITSDSTGSNTAGTTSPATTLINSSDVALCERITRKITSSSDRDELILNAYYTPTFASLIKKGCEAGDGEAPYLNYDFIGETQDDSPKPISIGPGKIVGNTIHVPYVQVHTYPNSRPFTKTWVFVKENGEWRASDILTSGREQGNGSMFANLKHM